MMQVLARITPVVADRLLIFLLCSFLGFLVYAWWKRRIGLLTALLWAFLAFLGCAVLAALATWLLGWVPGGIPVYGFGMMLFLAFLLCTWLAGRRAEKVGINKEVIHDVAIWVFLGGLLGARITYLLIGPDPAESVGEFFSRLPKIWDGGIILYGSVAGGVLGYALGWWFSFRKQGVETLVLADVVAPSIALGLALGRIGCFLNGCCYGQVVCADCKPTYPVHFPLSAPSYYPLVANGSQTAAGFTLKPGAVRPVVGAVEPDSPAARAGVQPGQVITEVDGHAVTDRDGLRLAVFNFDAKGRSELELKVEGRDDPIRYTPRTLGLHPTQLYETVSMLLLLLLLLAYSPFKSRDGQVMGLLMVCYAVHRYLNELLRSDDRPTGFEAYGSVILLAAGVALLVWLWRRRPRQYEPQWTV
jgi:phosphatidylglycerol---prolipoprotein diacylglyceryl transferase